MNVVLGQFSSSPTHGKAAGKARPGFVLNWLDCIKLMLTVATTDKFTLCSTYHLLCVSGIATLEASSMPEVKPRIACIVWNATD